MTGLQQCKHAIFDYYYYCYFIFIIIDNNGCKIYLYVVHSTSSFLRSRVGSLLGMAPARQYSRPYICFSSKSSSHRTIVFREFPDILCTTCKYVKIMYIGINFRFCETYFLIKHTWPSKCLGLCCDILLETKRKRRVCSLQSDSACRCMHMDRRYVRPRAGTRADVAWRMWPCYISLEPLTWVKWASSANCSALRSMQAVVTLEMLELPLKSALFLFCLSPGSLKRHELQNKTYHCHLWVVSARFKSFVSVNIRTKQIY